jgi:hypothetical protein
MAMPFILIKIEVSECTTYTAILPISAHVTHPQIGFKHFNIYFSVSAIIGFINVGVSSNFLESVLFQFILLVHYWTSKVDGFTTKLSFLQQKKNGESCIGRHGN